MLPEVNGNRKALLVRDGSDGSETTFLTQALLMVGPKEIFCTSFTEVCSSDIGKGDVSKF